LAPNWLECNGQTINDPASPFHGLTLPDLNTTNLFVRGAIASGATGGNTSHNHGYNATTDVTIGADTTVVHPSSSTTTENHLPPYFEAVWVIRINDKFPPDLANAAAIQNKSKMLNRNQRTVITDANLLLAASTRTPVVKPIANNGPGHCVTSILGLPRNTRSWTIGRMNQGAHRASANDTTNSVDSDPKPTTATLETSRTQYGVIKFRTPHLSANLCASAPLRLCV